MLTRLTSYAPHTPSVVAVVVVRRVHIAAIEVEVVGVGATIDRATPIVAVTARVLEQAIVHVARANDEQEM